jgi:glycine/D-amino acid oxidase-like deaminating enzyme
VGLNCALQLRQRYPSAKIVVLERGILPQGASTKNAGFACFGSISEILSDLKSHSDDEVVHLVNRRREGIQLLRKTLGDKQIGFQSHGGHELFLEGRSERYQYCLENLDKINRLLQPVFKAPAFRLVPNSFHFRKICKNYISNVFEGQLDTGQMMVNLLLKVQVSGIVLLNSVSVQEFIEKAGQVTVKTDHFEFNTKKLFIATNGFASQLVNEEVKPARAQVLITRPVKGLTIKGTFHLDEGYYYFRNIDNRILLGGGRQLDFKTEETTEFGQTGKIQDSLEMLLKEVILCDTAFEIEHRWSGIMGVGKKKQPIIRQLSDNVFCGVRLGGMGIAIGSSVGKELADLLPA